MRTIIASAVVGILIGAALVTLLVGWKLALAAVVIDIVAVLAGLASRAWGRGNRQADQIVADEVDAHRALEAERRELDDPDPLNNELRTPPVTRIGDTTGET